VFSGAAPDRCFAEQGEHEPWRSPLPGCCFWPARAYQPGASQPPTVRLLEDSLTGNQSLSMEPPLYCATPPRELKLKPRPRRTEHIGSAALSRESTRCWPGAAISTVFSFQPGMKRGYRLHWMLIARPALDRTPFLRPSAFQNRHGPPRIQAPLSLRRRFPMCRDLRLRTLQPFP
jgi:hypothetical protein